MCGAVAAAATVAFLIDRYYYYYYRCCDCDWRLADVMVVGIGGKVDDDAAVGLDCDVFVFVVFDDDLVCECWDIRLISMVEGNRMDG